MKRMKQLLAIFLSALMLLSVAPMALAEVEPEGPRLFLTDSVISESTMEVALAVEDCAGLEWADLDITFDTASIERFAGIVSGADAERLTAEGNGISWAGKAEGGNLHLSFFLIEPLSDDTETQLLRLRFEVSSSSQFRIDMGLSARSIVGVEDVSVEGLDNLEIRHQLGGRVVHVADSTCSERGFNLRTCSYCGEQVKVYLPLLDHTPEDDAAVAPTCTQTGLTAGVHCSVCGEVLTEQEVIAALNHDFDRNNGTVLQPASYTAPGTISYPCTRCDATLEEEIPQLGGFVVRYHDTAADDAVDVSTTVPAGETGTLETAAALGFAHEGYHFAGWELQRNIDGCVYAVDEDGAFSWAPLDEFDELPLGLTRATVADGAEVSDLAETGEVQAYGVWNVNDILFSYYNSVDSDTVYVDEHAPYTDEITIYTGDALGMNRDLRFNGWRIQRSMDGKWLVRNAAGDISWAALENGALPEGLTWATADGDYAVSFFASEGEISLYAQWTPFTFDVYYHVEDESPVETTVTHVTYQEATAAVSAETLGLTHGYDAFDGWKATLEGNVLAVDAEGEDVWVEPENGALPEGYTLKVLPDCADLSTLTREGDVHLIAQWRETPAPAMVVTSHPQSVTAVLNATASFTVAATGRGITYAWRSRPNSSASWTYLTDAFEGYNAATLQVPASMDLNGHRFQCVLTDITGAKAFSKDVGLIVVDPVKITTHPTSVTAVENTTATFTVAATGSGLTYAWRTRASGVTSWTYLDAQTEGYNTNTLKVPAAIALNGSRYQCVVTDASGAKAFSKDVALTVVSALAITEHPTAVTAVENTTATFTVVATGAGLTYAWRTRPNSSASWTYLTDSTEGYNAATLKVPAAMALNGSRYQCVVRDASGAVKFSRDVSLTVVSALAITEHPTAVTAVENTTATFTVVATGAGLTYAWRSKPNSSASWTYLTEATEGYNAATLKVPATMALNGSRYQCVVRDAAGAVKFSRDVALTVVPPLTITAHPVGVSVAANTTATFTVTAEGAGLTYAWRTRPNSSASWTYLTEATEGYNAATLKVPATADLNGSRYQCVVRDAAGTVKYSRDVALTVK